jgi:protein CpxP
MKMTSKIRFLLPSMAILSLVGAASVAVPSVAFAADKLTETDKAAVQKPIDHAEDRIKDIHEKLHITADQEPKFDKLAEVMRANAKDMSEAVEKREMAEKTTTALDDLKAYQKIAQAHADGLKDLVPAFESLYSGLSDSQKKEADALFTHGPDKKMGHRS